MEQDGVTLWAHSSTSGNFNIVHEASAAINLWTAGTKRLTVASAGNVGIGIAAPEGKLHVCTTTGGVAPHANQDDLVVENWGNHAGITIISGTSHSGYLSFSDDALSRGLIEYSQSSDLMLFYTAATEHMRIDSAGRVGIGGSPVSEYVASGKYLTIEGTSAAINFHETDGSGYRWEWAAWSNVFSLAQDASERIRIDGSGNVGIGSHAPLSKLHVNAVLTLGIHNSTNGVINAPESLHFNIDSDNTQTDRNFYWNTNIADDTPSSSEELMRLSDEGLLLIGDTANANMTVGLTINQGAADNEILAFKSDMSSLPTDHSENDTYATFSKSNASNGGLKITGAIESNYIGVQIESWNEGGATTKTTSTRGQSEMNSFLASGNSITNQTANYCTWAHRTYKGGSLATIFLIDEDGDFSYDGADGGAFDLWADAPLLRAFTHEMSDPATVVRSKWDEMVKYDRNHLVEADLIGYCSDEDLAKGIRPLVNGAQLDRALVGEAWQGYCRDMELAEKIETMQLQLNEANDKLARLEMN